MSAFPPVHDLVPHAEPMVLLDAVVAHDADATTCAASVDAQTVFREDDGGVPVWIALELMAQVIAVHAGLVGRAEGRERPQVGFLVGARGLRFHTERFTAGQHLVATARRRWAGSASLVAFDCELRDADGGTLLAEGRLSCFVPKDGA